MRKGREDDRRPPPRQADERGGSRRAAHDPRVPHRGRDDRGGNAEPSGREDGKVRHGGESGREGAPSSPHVGERPRAEPPQQKNGAEMEEGEEEDDAAAAAASPDKTAPKALEAVLKERQAAEAAAAQPVFMTKQQRQALALERCGLPTACLG